MTFNSAVLAFLCANNCKLGKTCRGIKAMPFTKAIILRHIYTGLQISEFLVSNTNCLHLSLPLMKSFNKSKAVIFPGQAVLP